MKFKFTKILELFSADKFLWAGLAFVAAAILGVMFATSGVSRWFQDDFYVTDDNWSRGVARKWAGYYVPGNSSGHEPGKFVRLKDGEIRRILRVEKKGPYLNVFVAGIPLNPDTHGTPSDYKIEPASPELVAADNFFLSDKNWHRGVARHWAGFFVPAESPGYLVGGRVKLANGEVRTVQRLDQKGPYLNVYLDGKPLEPLIHGTPPDFKLE